ncbi:MAG: DUF3341 domain-containing protein [Acidimicrobiia bacterium]|nr:DUF3341 domain-containing protein [Acidimicrobiia bacterium]
MDATATGTMAPPLVDGHVTAGQVTREVADATAGTPTRLWTIGLLLAVTALGTGVAAVAYLFATGIGTWGLNTTVGWGFDITNFVFWVGIGHAGTLISAILLLFRQRWRNAVNRSAEAMTLFAVACAGIFPLIHLGRPWLALWMLPYPNTRGSLWINFASPLVWDFFAISTYFTVSLIFWYVGLIPDLATLRDRTENPRARAVYRLFALGWDGSHRVWHNYESLYLLLAGLATPLVLSVHTVVSWDFGVSILPGWHSTIFPPYFVDGAILSGLAMVLTLLIVARKTMRFEHYITTRHLDAICYLIIVTGGIISVAYGIETFIALYSANPYEQLSLANRAFGPLGWGFWTMITGNVVVPQLLWFRAIRRNLVVLFVLSLFINVGMWFERFVIIVTSLERSFLESSWASYTPTLIEFAIFIGSFGLFFTGFLLFVRLLPVISIAEVKLLLPHDAGADAAPVEAPAPAGQRYLVYRSEAALLAGAREARQRGVPILDAYTPCPVHGLSEEMGLGRSRLPRFCLAGGVFGAAFMTGFIFWVSAIDWPLNIGGKPMNSLPAFVPPIFEATVLWAVFAAFVGFLIVAGLRPFKGSKTGGLGVTDDRFVLVVQENA